jgi:SGNH domain (fused to AT3 domains)
LRVRLAQITGPLCPPLLQATARAAAACPEMSRVALEQIRQLRPQLVILAGAWRTYALDEAGRSTADVDGLRDTLARLRGVGVSRVILVGSLPVWRTALPRLLLTEWRGDGDLPARLAQGLLPGQAALDEDLAALARGSGADYVSALGLLCSAVGCETLVQSGGKTYPMAYDEAHLSRAGSRLLAQRMLGTLGQGAGCAQPGLRPGPACAGSGP